MPSAPRSPAAVLRAAGPRRPARLDRSIILMLVGNSFPPLTALATAPILAQVLGVDGRGALAAATAPFLLATTAATLGIPEALTYTVARSPGVARRAGRTGMLLLAATGTLAGLAVLLAAPLLSAGDGALATLMTLAAVGIVPALCLGAVRGVASGLHRWDLVARERVLASLLRLAAVAGLALAGHLTPLTATMAFALSPVLAGVAYLPLRHLARHGPPAGRGPRETDAASAAPASRLLRYGSRVWVGSLSGVLLGRIDQLLMAPMSGTFELGLYVVAVNISEVPLVVNNAVRDVVFSADAGRRSDDRLTAAGRLSGAAVGAAAVVLGLSLPLWVSGLFGAEFAAAVPAAWVLLVAVAVGVPGSIAGAGLSARGRPELRSAALFVACVLNVAVLAVLVPAYGAAGAAVATLAGSTVASGLNLVFLHRLSGISPLAFYGLRRGDVAILVAVARRARALLRPATG